MGEVSEIKQIVEAGTKDAPVKDILWNASQIETERTRILDPGIGRPRILRHFFFKANPEILGPGKRRPVKQEIFNAFQNLIRINLWGDGLVVNPDHPPEIHTRKSVKGLSTVLYMEMVKNNTDFVIQVLAEPRLGQAVIERPLIAK